MNVKRYRKRPTIRAYNVVLRKLEEKGARSPQESIKDRGDWYKTFKPRPKAA